MSNATKISWTDATSNPLKYRDASGRDVWACVKVSAGCANCYAESLGHRYGRGKPFTAANMRTLAPYLDKKELKHLLTAKKLAGKSVFLNDMTDGFGAWVTDAMLDRMFAVFVLRRDVTFQLLTKRPERMAEYLDSRSPRVAGNVVPPEWLKILNDERDEQGRNWTTKYRHRNCYGRGQWPLPNVHLGVSVENQEQADARIPHLLRRCPAAVRWLSVEPLLGPVRLDQCAPYTLGGDESNPGVINAFNGLCHHPATVKFKPDGAGSDDGISWVVIGGESGPGYRPCQVEWIADIAAQCKAAGVACFVKQDAGPRPGMQGRIPEELWSLKEFPQGA